MKTGAAATGALFVSAAAAAANFFRSSRYCYWKINDFRLESNQIGGGSWFRAPREQLQPKAVKLDMKELITLASPPSSGDDA